MRDARAQAPNLAGEALVRWSRAGSPRKFLLARLLGQKAQKSPKSRIGDLLYGARVETRDGRA
jgi:hypothetical protein